MNQLNVNDSRKKIFAYLLKINLGVCTHTSLADQVDDPFLALVSRKVEPFRQITRR